MEPKDKANCNYKTFSYKNKTYVMCYYITIYQYYDKDKSTLYKGND